MQVKGWIRQYFLNKIIFKKFFHIFIYNLINLNESLTQNSYGGQHLPLGGGTVPRNSPSKAKVPIVNHHHKQRSWDPLESGVDDLKGK